MAESREKAFIEEYQALLHKYGVALVIDKRHTEYGTHIYPHFRGGDVNWTPGYNTKILSPYD